MNIDLNTLYFNFANWKLSTAKASLGMGPRKEKKLMEEEMRIKKDLMKIKTNYSYVAVEVIKPLIACTFL